MSMSLERISVITWPFPRVLEEDELSILPPEFTAYSRTTKDWVVFEKSWLRGTSELAPGIWGVSGGERFLVVFFLFVVVTCSSAPSVNSCLTTMTELL